MSITDLFSKRQKKLRGEVPDVFVYDELPHPFRVQVVQIWNDAIGTGRDHYSGVDQAAQLYLHIHNTLAREYGVFSLAKGDDGKTRLQTFLLNEPTTEKVLDAIELSFQYIVGVCEDYYKYRNKVENLSLLPPQAVNELNHRFLEHGLGYQFEGNEIIRKDSEIIHSEVVKPVLTLLHDKRFQGAEEEFLKAHEHYRHGDFKECLNECLKAMESTLKSICTIRNWTYQPGDTAKALLKICFDKELIPSFMQSQFDGLRAVLEGGVPTLRNKMGGHGQGEVPVPVPAYFASYMLHLTATTILFLVEANNNFGQS
jgi:hypothetical protein